MTDKARVATASLAGCFGCHMSVLDIDERLLELIQVVVKDREVNDAYTTARELAEFVRGEGSRTFRVLGPAVAPLARIRGLYRFQVLLMGRDRPAMNERLRSLLELWGRRGPKARKALRSLEVDVDPLALL